MTVETRSLKFPMEWKAFAQVVVIIAMLIGASYAGVQVSMNVDFASRVEEIESRLDAPVNSSLSGLQKPYTEIVSMVGAYYVRQNGTDGRLILPYSTNKTFIQQQSLGNVTTGSVYLKEMTLASGLTYGSTVLIIQQYQGQLSYYSNNALVYTVKAGSLNATVIYAGVLNASTNYVQTYRLLVENGTSFPSSPSSGYLFFRTDYNLLTFYNGTGWTNCTTGSFGDLSIYLLKDGSRALTGNWNVGGSFGIYGATWLNSTSLNSLNYFLDGQQLGFVQQASFTVDYNASSDSYQSWHGSNSTLAYRSTNASKVIMACAYANTTIQFKEGNFAIDYLIPVNVSGIHFVGSGWGTQFTIGAGGGFNISSSSVLNDISFESIYWRDAGGSGTAVATMGITSAMPANTRISHFVFKDNRVDYFRKAGTIFLNLTNPEVGTISNNFFYSTRTAFIQLLGNLYQSGNNKIYDNVFYGGYDANNENAIRITANAGNSSQTSSMGDTFSWGNQWYGQHYDYGGSFYAWNQTVLGTYANVGGIYSSGDRYENTAPLVSVGVSNSYPAVGGIFSDNTITSQNVTTAFTLGNFTLNTIISNNYVALQSASTFLVENYTTDYRPNVVHDNTFAAIGTFFMNASGYSRIYSNTNYNPVGYVANWKSPGSRIAPYNGYASTFTNATTYRVSSMPVYFNVTGGTGVNITVSDFDGNALITGATSLFWFYMPIDFKITCVYATSPTAVVIFN